MNSGPGGGYFAWLRLADAYKPRGDAFAAFLRHHQKRFGVSMLHGPRCAAAEEGILEKTLDPARFAHCFRVSWAFYEPAELAEGVRRLRAAWEAFL